MIYNCLCLDVFMRACVCGGTWICVQRICMRDCACGHACPYVCAVVGDSAAYAYSLYVYDKTYVFVHLVMNVYVPCLNKVVCA